MREISGVFICGIPVNDDGLYYCPYCGFSSDSLEPFATSMCWDCVFPEEEDVKPEQQEEEQNVLYS